MLVAADAGGRGTTSTATRAQQNCGDQVSIEKARENGDSRARIRNPRDPKPRPEVPDPRVRDSEAQTGRHAESPWSYLLEAGCGRDIVSTVRRAPSSTQLSGQFCATATSAGSKSAAELRHRVPSKGRGVRDRFLSAG